MEILRAEPRWKFLGPSLDGEGIRMCDALGSRAFYMPDSDEDRPENFARQRHVEKMAAIGIQVVNYAGVSFKAAKRRTAVYVEATTDAAACLVKAVLNRAADV